MDQYFPLIASVILKHQINLFLVHQCDRVETAGFIKYNFATNSPINDILKYEKEFQFVINDCWMEARNGYISICIPKKKLDRFSASEIFESDFYRSYQGVLKFAIGQDPNGEMVLGDLEKMVNILIGGIPNSGKSNLLNVIINSFIQRDEREVQLVLFDLKKVELSQYRDIPHLLSKPITDLDHAQRELLSLISEMKRRYYKLESARVKNIQQFRRNGGQMPFLVVIVDELAELILNKKECENQLIRLAQKGRAAGIHLILATQKPNANIVTPLISGSIDTRIAFKTSSFHDSTTILGCAGAEKLRPQAECLLRDDTLTRIHTCYIADEQIRINIEAAKKTLSGMFDDDSNEIMMLECENTQIIEDIRETDEEPGTEEDEEMTVDELDFLYKMALDFVKSGDNVNKWRLKKKLKIGDNKVEQILDRLFKEKILSPIKIGNSYVRLKEDF